MVPPFTLHQLLPFLKGSTLQDQELPDTPLDQIASAFAKGRKKLDASGRFAALLKARKQAPSSAGVVFQMMKGSSTADIIIDFPLVPGVDPGIRVVEVQVKAPTQQKNATPLSVLHKDCCKKATISINPNEWTLHILSATKMTGDLQNMIPASGILVLRPGQSLIYQRGLNAEEKRTTKQRMASASEEEQKQAENEKIDVPFKISEQLYIVVLSPDVNNNWLQNTL